MCVEKLMAFGVAGVCVEHRISGCVWCSALCLEQRVCVEQRTMFGASSCYDAYIYIYKSIMFVVHNKRYVPCTFVVF